MKFVLKTNLKIKKSKLFLGKQINQRMKDGQKEINKDGQSKRKKERKIRK